MTTEKCFISESLENEVDRRTGLTSETDELLCRIFTIINTQILHLLIAIQT